MSGDTQVPSLNPYAGPQVDAAAVVPAATQIVPPRRPRIWTVLVTFVAAVLAVIAAQIVGGIALVAWYLASGGTIQQLQSEVLDLVTSPGPFIAINALTQLAMAAPALAAAWLSPQPLRQRLGLVSPSLRAGSIAVLVLGVIVPLLIGIGLALAVAEVIEPDQSVKRLYEQMTAAWALPFILFIALAPGFCEELLFRGYLQRRLVERWGAVAGILIASLVFGLFHMMPHAIAFAIPIGIWLGLLAWRTGSTWPGIICHAALNGLWNVRNVGIALGYCSEEVPLWLWTLLGGVGSTAFAWSLWILFRTPRDVAEATGIPASPAAQGP
jgi:membrane protease YdiL (CAAX protease family)